MCCLLSNVFVVLYVFCVLCLYCTRALKCVRRCSSDPQARTRYGSHPSSPTLTCHHHRCTSCHHNYQKSYMFSIFWDPSLNTTDTFWSPTLPASPRADPHIRNLLSPLSSSSSPSSPMQCVSRQAWKATSVSPEQVPTRPEAPSIRRRRVLNKVLYIDARIHFC